MVITKEIDLKELIENLEELNHLLLFKNRKFVRKYLSKLIDELKNSQNKVV